MALDGKVCYFTFGRFQPPTVGHAENFDGVKRAAGKNDYLIYISQSEDKKGSNPLPPSLKLSYMNKRFYKGFLVEYKHIITCKNMI